MQAEFHEYVTKHGLAHVSKWNIDSVFQGFDNDSDGAIWPVVKSLYYCTRSINKSAREHCLGACYRIYSPTNPRDGSGRTAHPISVLSMSMRSLLC